VINILIYTQIITVSCHAGRNPTLVARIQREEWWWDVYIQGITEGRR
jgi:hypothetical protein